MFYKPTLFPQNKIISPTLSIPDPVKIQPTPKWPKPFLYFSFNLPRPRSQHPTPFTFIRSLFLFFSKRTRAELFLFSPQNNSSQRKEIACVDLSSTSSARLFQARNPSTSNGHKGRCQTKYKISGAFFFLLHAKRFPAFPSSTSFTRTTACIFVLPIVGLLHVKTQGQEMNLSRCFTLYPSEWF